jgi:hypothetical protein
MPNVGDNRPSGSIQNDLIFDEIRAIVAEAIKGHSVLWVAPHVERLIKTYGTAGFSKGRIADEIILAASRAKIPVHIEAVSLSDADPLPAHIRPM